MPKKQPDGSGTSGYEIVFKGLAGGVSNVAGFLVGRMRSAAGGLGLSRKAEREWTATLRVWNVEEHRWEVAFGNGPDPIDALLSLNSSVVKGKFYEDKFAKGTMPDWKVVSADTLLRPLGRGKGKVGSDDSGQVEEVEER